MSYLRHHGTDPCAFDDPRAHRGRYMGGCASAHTRTMLNAKKQRGEEERLRNEAKPALASLSFASLRLCVRRLQPYCETKPTRVNETSKMHEYPVLTGCTRSRGFPNEPNAIVEPR